MKIEKKHKIFSKFWKSDLGLEKLIPITFMPLVPISGLYKSKRLSFAFCILSDSSSSFWTISDALLDTEMMHIVFKHFLCVPYQIF